MTKYLLRIPGTFARILYVRSFGGWWHVYQLPVELMERRYPNDDFDTGRRYYHSDLRSCYTVELMQAKLDEYAKIRGLEKWEDQ